MEGARTMKGIDVFEFGTFTFAQDILNYCVQRGYRPYVDPEGRIHPGTICNAALYTLMKDPAAKRKFGISSRDVVDVRFGSRKNEDFIEVLIEEGLITAAHRSRPGVTLYSAKAASYLCAVMLNDPSYIDSPFEIRCPVVFAGRIDATPHRFEKKKYQRPAKLFEGRG